MNRRILRRLRAEAADLLWWAADMVVLAGDRVHPGDEDERRRDYEREPPTWTPVPVTMEAGACTGAFFYKEWPSFPGDASEIRSLRASVQRLMDQNRELEETLEGYAQDEPPIVKGALDAQADAEKRMFAARRQADDLAAQCAALRAELAGARSALAAAHQELMPKRLEVITKPPALDRRRVYTASLRDALVAIWNGLNAIRMEAGPAVGAVDKAIAIADEALNGPQSRQEEPA